MAIITEHRPSTEERLSYIEGVLPHLATKADIAESEARTATRIAESEARTCKRISESKVSGSAQLAGVWKELAELRIELAKSEARLKRRGTAALIVAVAIIAILIRLLG